MKMVIMQDNGKILAEYDSDQVKALLCLYFDKYNNIGKAYEEVEAELKKQILTK